MAPHDGGVLIAVEDDGPGVPVELREAIFEPFRQGPTASPHSPGTGIGLSLVARFAELHGGRAWVEDREGGGASFRVFLPGRVARPRSTRRTSRRRADAAEPYDRGWQPVAPGQTQPHAGPLGNCARAPAATPCAAGHEGGERVVVADALDQRPGSPPAPARSASILVVGRRRRGRGRPAETSDRACRGRRGSRRRVAAGRRRREERDGRRWRFARSWAHDAAVSARRGAAPHAPAARRRAPAATGPVDASGERTLGLDARTRPQPERTPPPPADRRRHERPRREPARACASRRG